MFQSRDGAGLPALPGATPDTPRKLEFALQSRVFLRQHRSPALPFASLSSAGLAGSCCSSKRAISQREERTGLEFPEEVNTASGSAWLVGTGSRTKRILGIKDINVYALGLYVEPSAAKKCLTKYKDKDNALETQEFYNDVISSKDLGKTLKVIVSFGGLKRHHFVNAIEERLAPVMTADKDQVALEQFKHQFDDVAFHRGLQIDFTHTHDNVMLTRVQDKEVCIPSEVLCRQFFSLYLGQNPVSAEAKQHIGMGLSSLLKS